VCRHLAYLGPPVPLSRWLFDAPHAMVHQASAPADMRGGGTVNADGFGVGWHPEGQHAPVRYRRPQPMWTDAGLPSLAAATVAGSVLAAVRSATTGMPVQESACAPFAANQMLFSLNGRVAGWPDSVAGLAGRLPVTELLGMEAPTDSVLVWTLLRQRLNAGERPARAVAATVTEVAAAAPGSRLNLLLTDAHTIVATTLTHALAVRRDAGAVLVSSEPLDDDPAWTKVPDGCLVVATPAEVDITPLPLTGGNP
jgi:gamma-glutamyl hercynylcysteine S-oxide hydrolase